MELSEMLGRSSSRVAFSHLWPRVLYIYPSKRARRIAANIATLPACYVMFRGSWSPVAALACARARYHNGKASSA
jgi:hypothetical protein